MERKKQFKSQSIEMEPNHQNRKLTHEYLETLTNNEYLKRTCEFVFGQNVWNKCMRNFELFFQLNELW